MKYLGKIIGFAYAYIFGFVPYARKVGVKVGDGCRIYILSWGSEPFLVTIGSRVTVSSKVRFITHDGSTWLIRDEAGRRYQKYRPIVVGDDVFIGSGSIIMPGVTIGSQVIVGAGSVVTKNVPDGAVVAGNPAKYIRSFSSLREKVVATCPLDEGVEFSTYQDKVNYFVDKQRDE